MILLDTHTLIWMVFEPEKLSQTARQVLTDARTRGERVACSQVSLFEIATAVRRRRIRLRSTMEELLAGLGPYVRFVPVTSEVAICAGEIPEPFHGDPIDRMIAATALVGNYTLITNDARIRRSGLCKVIW